MNSASRNLLITATIILSIFSAILLTQCNSTETIPVKDPSDEKVFSGDRISFPIALAIYDIKEPTTIIQNLEVTIIDPLGKVRTPNGDSVKTFKLETGMLTLGILEGTEIDKSNWYQFSIRVEGPRYARHVFPLVLKEEKPIFRRLYLVEYGNPGPGMVSIFEQFSIQDPIPEGGLSFQSQQNLLGQSANITIPPGTKFYSEGKLVEAGSATLKCIYGNPFERSSGLAMPYGSKIYNAISKTKEIIATPERIVYHRNAGWLEIEIETSEGMEIDSLTNMIVELPLNSKLINPSTNSQFNFEDTIPIWRYDETNEIWRELNTSGKVKAGEVNNPASAFISELQLNHLSSIRLGYFDTQACTENVTVSVTNERCPRLLASLVEVDANPPIVGLWSESIKYYNTSTNVILEQLPVIDFDPNTGLGVRGISFEVFNHAIDVTDPANSLGSIDLTCPSEQPFPISLQPIPEAPCPMLGVYVILNETDSICNTSLWYKSIPSSYNPDNGNDQSGDWKLAGFFDGSGSSVTFNPGPEIPAMPVPEDDIHYRCMIWFGNDGDVTSPGEAIYFTLSGAVLHRFNLNSASCRFTPTHPTRPRQRNVDTGLLKVKVSRACFDDAPNSGDEDCNSESIPFNCDIAPPNTTNVKGIIVEINQTPSGALCS